MNLRDKLGICQWFHYAHYAEVERVVAWLREAGVRHLRTGISWADYQSRQQKQRLCRAAAAPTPRVYWYSLADLAPGLPAIEGLHVDENEYHLGLITHDGIRKPAWRRFCRLLNHSATDARRPSAEASVAEDAGG